MATPTGPHPEYLSASEAVAVWARDYPPDAERARPSTRGLVGVIAIAAGGVLGAVYLERWWWRALCGLVGAIALYLGFLLVHSIYWARTRASRPIAPDGRPHLVNRGVTLEPRGDEARWCPVAVDSLEQFHAAAEFAKADRSEWVAVVNGGEVVRYHESPSAAERMGAALSESRGYTLECTLALSGGELAFRSQGSSGGFDFAGTLQRHGAVLLLAEPLPDGTREIRAIGPALARGEKPQLVWL